MKAYLLTGTFDLEKESSPLVLENVPLPEPGKGEVRIKVSVCGICHTELDEIEGRTPPPKFPVIPGHQVIGIVEKTGPGSQKFKTGGRVGVGWIFSSCGKCRHCLSGNENLCEEFLATGRDKNGGYGEFMVAPENFVYKIPPSLSDLNAAPLLCAGAIGYRSVMLCNGQNKMKFGLMGFGASAHLVIQIIHHLYPDSPVYVFSRDQESRHFAKKLGAEWAGDIAESPPQKVDRIIDTTPAWKPVIESLGHLAPGGRLVINSIRKENRDIDCFNNLKYENHLWHEKEIKSVANITRKDLEDFLRFAAEIPIKPEVTTYYFQDANKALLDLKKGKGHGAKVLIINS